MKPIAIMTMAFLPATFFAALFAVPSLQWTADEVITKNFWIYWAFTVPLTLVIFGLWLVITKWDSVWVKARKIVEERKSELKSREDG